MKLFAHSLVTPQPGLNHHPRTVPAFIHCIEEELVKTIVALAVMSLAFAAPANAQEQQQSFKTILGKGYDIKNVTFAKGESTDNRESFVVTLQKEKSVAVCYFAAANWINLSAGVLEDSKRCDVRY
jgi:hypothetical protein